ncbi:MAG: hypothetical protein AAFQ90_03965 [Pseudomonadota bacterium]
MARKSDNAFTMRIAALVGGVLVLGAGGIVIWPFITQFGDQTSEETVASGPCLPSGAKEIWLRNRETARVPGNIQMYYDASGGMQGYVKGGSKVFGNLASQTENFSRSSLFEGNSVGVEFRTFGEYDFDPANPGPPTLAASKDALSDRATYSENDTKIADLLGWVIQSNKAAPRGSKPLSIVVTDLMLDDKEATDDFAASVGGRLQDIVIQERLAVGFLGVKVPFDGPVYVAQGDTESEFGADLRARPLMILIIGDPYHVRSYYEYLRGTDGIVPFSANTPEANHAFSVFSLDASEVVRGSITSAGIDSGFDPVPGTGNLPASIAAARLVTYSFDRSTDDDAEGGLGISLAADADLKPYDVVGDQPIWASDIWRLNSNFSAEDCETGRAWDPFKSLPGQVESDGDKLSYFVTADVMGKLRLRPGTYLFLAAAGRKGLTLENEKSAWMRDWSMSNPKVAENLAASSQREIGTPGLDSLRTKLLTELRLPQRENVWRSASQFIITVE